MSRAEEKFPTPAEGKGTTSVFPRKLVALVLGRLERSHATPVRVARLGRSGSRLNKKRHLGDAGGGSLRADVLLSPAVFEAETIPVHLQNVNVMSEPVQQRASQALGTHHFGPFREKQVLVTRVEARS